MNPKASFENKIPQQATGNLPAGRLVIPLPSRLPRRTDRSAAAEREGGLSLKFAPLLNAFHLSIPISPGQVRHYTQV